MKVGARRTYKGIITEKLKCVESYINSQDYIKYIKYIEYVQDDSILFKLADIKMLEECIKYIEHLLKRADSLKDSIQSKCKNRVGIDTDEIIEDYNEIADNEVIPIIVDVVVPNIDDSDDYDYFSSSDDEDNEDNEESDDDTVDSDDYDYFSSDDEEDTDVEDEEYVEDEDNSDDYDYFSSDDEGDTDTQDDDDYDYFSDNVEQEEDTSDDYDYFSSDDEEDTNNDEIDFWSDETPHNNKSSNEVYGDKLTDIFYKKIVKASEVVEVGAKSATTKTGKLAKELGSAINKIESE